MAIKMERERERERAYTPEITYSARAVSFRQYRQALKLESRNNDKKIKKTEIKITRMLLSRAHTSTKAADVTKLLLLNKCRITTSSHAQLATPT